MSSPVKYACGSKSARHLPDFEFIVPKEAPVFEPTNEEFEDALAFIRKIRPTAEKFGICKIKPPPGWQPPFTVDVDNFKFTPRIQRLNELEAQTRIKLNFLDKIAKFWELQGSSLKIPTVEKRQLDLYSLHKLVQEDGGSDTVTREKKWNKIATKMGFPVGRGVDSQLKSHYNRILHPYDVFDEVKDVPNVKSEYEMEDGKKPDKDYKPHSIATRQEIKPPFEKYGRRSKRFGLDDEVHDVDDIGCGSTDSVENKELRRLTFYGAGPKMAGYHMIMRELKPKKKARTKKVENAGNADPLSKYVCQNCSRGDVEESMLLCDGCDDSYHTFCLVPPLTEIPRGDWRCPKCVAEEVSKPMEAFGFEQARREYTLQQFGEMADKFKMDYFRTPAHSVPSSIVEREFWRLVSSIDEDVTVEYGADLHTMDHGSGFPTKFTKNLHPVDQKYADSDWNLNNLPVLEASVLGHINADVSGMKVPWMYVGMCFATFCWHNEDHWSYSINYLHWGEPKTWYGVPGGKAEIFESAMKRAAPELFHSQPDFSETKLRKALLEWGVVDAERESFETLQDDERQCDVCKTTCYLSAITCSCNPKRIVCLRHYSSLCGCPAKNHSMKYQFILDELLEMLQKLKFYAESFDKWSENIRNALSHKYQQKVTLSRLKELFQEAEEKNFPEESSLMNSIRLIIEKGEKYSNVAQKILNRRACASNDKVDCTTKLTVEEVTRFYEEIEDLAVLITERDEVKDLVENVKSFEKMAEELLSKDNPQNEELKQCIEAELALNAVIHLTDISKLKELWEKSNWFENIRNLEESTSNIKLETLQRLVNIGVSLPTNKNVEKHLANLKDLLSKVEEVEQRANSLLTQEYRVQTSDIQDVLEAAKKVSCVTPSVTELQNALEKGNEWSMRVKKIFSTETYPTLLTVESLVEEAKWQQRINETLTLEEVTLALKKVSEVCEKPMKSMCSENLKEGDSENSQLSQAVKVVSSSENNISTHFVDSQLEPNVAELATTAGLGTITVKETQASKKPSLSNVEQESDSSSPRDKTERENTVSTVFPSTDELDVVSVSGDKFNIPSGDKNFSLKLSNNTTSQLVISLSAETSLHLEKLMMEADLMEVSLDDNDKIWKILKHTKKRKGLEVFPDIKEVENEIQANKLEREEQKARKRTVVESCLIGQSKKLRSAAEGRKTKSRAEVKLVVCEGKDDMLWDNGDDCAAQLCLQPQYSSVDWVQCDGGCDEWFHLLCVGLHKGDLQENEDYICKGCKENQEEVELANVMLEVDCSTQDPLAMDTVNISPTNQDLSQPLEIVLD
uniref:[histone H3]-trimethyl-L-lysine(4) demethylase n=1 Tax=Timema shepardi TaxID=629360 RepID=A0A7R9AW69_TIMSH|nr:unnamed protein product [Timema shepardi]